MKEPNPKVVSYLENLHITTDTWKVNPADLYRGSHSVISTKDTNPDWMAQSAHSIREITYLLKKSSSDPEKKILVKQAFEVFIQGVVYEDLARELVLVETTFTKIAHHGSLKEVKAKLSKRGIETELDGKICEEEYFKALKFADDVLLKVLPLQVVTHNEIDEVIKVKPNEELLPKVKYLISVNDDTRDYFYSVAPADWIVWLHEKSFFAVLNQKPEDDTSYSYRMPELNYLERVVVEQPDEVAKIILEVDCINNYNPEVVDRFTRITETLKGENLAKVVGKIHEENWVKLMQKFNTWSHAYEAIAKRLFEEGNIDSLIQLADVIMSVNADRDAIRSNPFVLSYIGDISALEMMTSLEDQDQLFKVYKFLITKLAEIIGEGIKEDADTRVFKIEEPYYFYDVDLFDHGFGDKQSHSYRDDMENLMAAIVITTKRIFEVGCGTEERLRQVYEFLDTTMPDSWSGWRLRLFTASFCGELFREELQTMFNRLFVVMDEGKSYYEIESGTEYKKALQRSWSELGHEFKQEYIQNIFRYFDPSKFEGDEKNWRTRDALQILRMTGGDIDDARVRKVFGYPLDDKRIPEVRPTITRGGFGAVLDRSPIVIADQKVNTLPALLKTDLKPEIIEGKYKDDPFHNPRSVEGVGSELRADVSNRLEEYLDIISAFFDPDEIHSHYTYSVLEGVEGVLRNKKTFSEESWKKLFAVLEKIEQSDLKESEEKEKSFLASWNSVRRNSAYILLYTLDKDFLSDEIFLEYRKRILKVIVSLLGCSDPKPEHETEEYGDLLTVAINHTQGTAYRAYIQFLYRDGEELLDDTKVVFEDLLKANKSLSTFSMIGQYLPSIYFRDQNWIKHKLPDIFSQDNREQFFAAWEGYVTASVYYEVFEAMESSYLFALTIPGAEYPRRNDRGRDLDQAVGTHLSLAFTHFEQVDLGHVLIKVLWEKADMKKQGEFISHIGRGYISSNNVASNEKTDAKVIALWDWLLAKKKGEIAPEVYGEFGLWIRDRGVEDIVPLSELANRFAKLLELSNGRLDYEYHLKDKLVELAVVDAEAVLSIMRSLLLCEEGEMGRNIWKRSHAASVDTFSVLYKAMPKETSELINELIEKKGRVYWGLKDVIKD